MSSVPQFVQTLQADLLKDGIDIVQPLALNWYNQGLPEHAAGSRIPELPPSGGGALTLIIGNSAAIWRPFLAACAADAALLSSSHPLETYIERSVDAAIAAAFQTSSFRLFWSHRLSELEQHSAFVAMQRMAEYAGLAYLDHESHLSMHPIFGPWFALRCAVVFDDETYLKPRPAPLACPMTPETVDNVKAAAAIALGKIERVPEMTDVRAGWEQWLAVRDAASPAKHPHRYCEAQLLYHYTGDRSLLCSLVADTSKPCQNLGI